MDGYRVDDSLGFLTNRLATAMRYAFEKRLEEFGLTAPQYGFLARLFEGDGQSLSSIGKSLYCDKPTMTGIANRLEKKGFIRKVRDEEDRRVIKAVLTENGRRLRDVLHNMAKDLNAEALNEFSEKEIKLFKSMLKMSLDNVLKMVEGGVINV